MTAQEQSGARRRRSRTWLLVALAVLVLTGVVLGPVLGRESGGSDGATATPPTASAPATTTDPTDPGDEPTGPEGTGGVPGPTGAPPAPLPNPDPEAPPPSLPAVPLDGSATSGDGVTATLRAVESVQGDGYGPGQVDGPAVRVTVVLRNDTTGTLSLDGVSVDIATGADALPGSPIDDPATRRFAGELAAGQSAEGVYVFTTQGQGPVTVTVGHRAGAPLLVFTGTP